MRNNKGHFALIPRTSHLLSTTMNSACHRGQHSLNIHTHKKVRLSLVARYSGEYIHALFVIDNGSKLMTITHSLGHSSSLQTEISIGVSISKSMFCVLYVSLTHTNFDIAHPHPIFIIPNDTSLKHTNLSTMRNQPSQPPSGISDSNGKRQGMLVQCGGKCPNFDKG